MPTTPNGFRHDNNGHESLQGFDYIELYVGNARQAAHFYRTAFGFTPIAHSGLETGMRDRASIVVQQNDAKKRRLLDLGARFLDSDPGVWTGDLRIRH